MRAIGLVRFSWSTAKKIMEEKGPEVTWEDDGDEDDDEEAASTLASLDETPTIQVYAVAAVQRHPSWQPSLPPDHGMLTFRTKDCIPWRAFSLLAKAWRKFSPAYIRSAYVATHVHFPPFVPIYSLRWDDFQLILLQTLKNR